MRANPGVHYVLGDEALTRGLGDEEARVLIEWLVEKAEEMDASASEDGTRRLCRRARAISRFVSLWGQRRTRGAALQLAAAERFGWPLPDGPIEPCLLMEHILAWEDQEAEYRRAA